MKERSPSTPLLSLIVVGLLALACGFPQPGPASTPGLVSTPEAQPTTGATPPPITVLTMPPTPAADSESIRYVPIRWVELHAPDHPECRRSDGTAFAGPLPATDPGAWRSSERLSWIIARTNDVYAGTGIKFWLQSYDAYCAETLARREGDADTLYSWSEVRADLQMIFPHAQFYDLSADRLSRMRWIEKAFLLYGDRHGKMVVVHNDHVQGIEGARHSPDILPQHGFGPWYTPGVVFMFLSADTWAANWQFAPEMTLAHELGRSLGNCHALDFDRCIGPGGTGDAIFPDRSSYTWADHWDLAYVDNGGVITGFESHDQAERWIAGHGTYWIGRIDDHFSIFLEPSSGRATVELSYDPDLTFHSETQVPTVDGGQVRLLQGLSFDFEYGNRFTFDYRTQNPPQPYSWQRNIMSYRYAREINSYPDTRRDEMDPYDYLTARFSQSQIELMQRQLAGSTPFVVSLHGIRPPGTWDLFASQYQLLGDGVTEDFVWYSNGESPADVDAGDDLPDRIAFRMAPAGSVVLDTAADLVAGDFNGDGLTDLLWHDAQRPSTLLWSRVEPEEGTPGVHQWDEESLAASVLAGHSPVFAGDFDGNGADDLFLARPGENIATVVDFRSDPSCRSFASCQSQTTTAQVGGIEGPVAVGNFDGRNGDDFLWASVSGGTTVTHVFWSNADGSFTADTATDVGGAEYIPYAGNFNGIGGDDVLWYDPSAGNEVLWWGAGGEAGGEHRMLCGPGGSSDCIDVSWNVISASPRLTIGDFDGNGADDILIQDTHEPLSCFSSQGSQTVYAGSYTVLQVALRSSRDYLAAVGEFDGASDDSGQLGEDVFLYYRPIAP